MPRWNLTFALLASSLILGGPPTAAQTNPPLAGRWALNRQLSQFPTEIGFGSDLVPPTGREGAASSGGGGRGRGGRSGDASNPFLGMRREGEDDVNRLRQLTDEARDPSVSLVIVESQAAVTMTDDRGRSRTVHPNGKEEILQLDQVPVMTTTRWEAGRLVVQYKVEEGRQLRYTYSRTADPPQLVVEVLFVERGGRDSARRIYDPVAASDPLPVRPAPVPPAPSAPPAASGARPSSGTPGAPVEPANPVFAQQPGSELKGLTKLGIVVEELGQQAIACGLNQSTIETTLSKSLTDAGLRVTRNTDDDTYLYVNVMTASVSNGLCVSRYDVSLNTHTTTPLSYQSTPVLVQVSLIRKGGMTGGAPAAHAANVMRDLKQWVDQFVSQIRDANR